MYKYVIQMYYNCITTYNINTYSLQYFKKFALDFFNFIGATF